MRFSLKCPGGPDCPLEPQSDNVASLWLAISLAILLVLWVIIILVICFRKRRARKYSLELEKLQAEDDERLADNRPSYASDGGDYREYERPGFWRGVRRTVRRVFCFCKCCYDPHNGNLRCCYSCLRGRIETGAHPRYSQLQELHLTNNDAPPNFVRTDAPVTLPLMASPEQRQQHGSTELPPARAEAYLNSGNALQTVSLEDTAALSDAGRSSADKQK